MILTFKSHDLKRLLGNAVLFACKDETLPGLCVVRLAFDGEYLHMVATDRYVLSREPAREVHVEGERREISIRTADVKAIVRALPTRGVADVRIESADEGGPVTVALDGHAMTFATDSNGTFPSGWLELSRRPEAAERSEITFNMEYLALFAKVDTGSPKHHTARFTLSAAMKPTLVEMGETFKAIVMPINAAG